MSDMSSEITYRFSAPNILKVTTFLLLMALSAIVATLVTLIRVLPFGINVTTVYLVLIVTLPTVIVLWVAKVWWFDFARFLLGAKQFRMFKGLACLSLLLLVVLVVVRAYGFWTTEDARSISRLLMMTLLLFGGNSTATVLEPYLNYRHDYPRREKQFLDYCNEKREIG